MERVPELGSMEENAWKRLEELRSVSDYFESDVGGISNENCMDKDKSDSLETEKRSEKQEKTFPCSECGEEFDSRIELNSHKAISHNEESEEEGIEGEGVFRRIYERAKENYERILENTQESIRDTYSRISSYASGFMEKAKDKVKEAYNLIDYFPDVQMERVNSYELGQGVLGRAFPWQNKIQIDESLYGMVEDKVIEHELEHIKNPWKSELQVRMDTDTLYLGLRR
mgnify:CR=1 FL=1